MNKKQIEEIKNYGKQIKTMGSYQEAVRHTVGQYLGYTGNRGFLNMFREIFQNSADELIKDSSPCDEIWVAYDEAKVETMIKDNGRGIPFNDIVRVFGKEHTSSNYIKTPGEFSSGRHGVGSKAVNACSDFFIVDSFILGKHRRVTFRYGNPKTAKVEDLPNKDNYQGTIITFKPIDRMPMNMGDESGKVVMGKITVQWQEVLDLIQHLLPLLKVGAKVNFIGIDNEKMAHEFHLVNRNGLMDGLQEIVSSPLITPIHFSKMREDGQMKAEIVFTYDLKSAEEEIKSFGNFCPTRDGTHVKGFIDGLTKYFKDYMNKFYLSSKSKLSITNNDIRSGLKAIVSVAHLEPEFTGQAKENISNTDLVPFVKELTIQYLTEWSKKNPNDLQKLCKYFKDIAEIRDKAEKGRVKIEVKNASAISGLPAKYIKPTGKEHTELFIVEGDSAKGSITNNRVNERQGIFPIRGKIKNAFSSKREDLLKNSEIAGLIAIIGAGYGRNFDIDKCNWEKVVICTDADPDGAHIRTLLLKFFLLYMEPLITSGKLFATVPPLFGGKINKKFRYFTDRSEYNAYVQNLFAKSHVLTTEGGAKLTKQFIINLLNDNEEYVETVERISNGYAIDPYLLEDISLQMNEPYSKFKKAIEKKYRFIQVSRDRSTKQISVDGVVDDKYQRILFNDNLMYQFAEVNKFLENSPTSYRIDGEKYSLYGLLKFIKSIEPKSITRYKGLGEMDGKQLFESTIDPNGQRILMRYSVDDVKTEIDRLRKIESNNNILFKDIDISKFIF